MADDPNGIDPAAAAYPEYGYLINDPVIGQILRDAYANKWPNSKTIATIEATDWFKTNADSVRKYNFLANADPAQLAQNVQQMREHIENIAAQTGIMLPGPNADDYANQAVRFNWDDVEIRRHLTLPGVNFYADSPILAQIKQQASQYLVPMSDATLKMWATNIASGSYSQQNFDSYLKEQAKSMFPGLAAAIDQGVTVQQYVAPYKQIAAQTLEVAPDSIDMMDPKWNRALNQVDPKTGGRVSMTLYDWQALMRTDPQYGYDKTSGARTQAADLTTQLAKEFGAIGA